MKQILSANISKAPLKPFIKWAGGKGQLLFEIRKNYPKELGEGINKYVEPFVGGGAVLFDIISNYEMEKIYIGDINEELINAYKIIRDDILTLINRLKFIQDKYWSMNIENRKLYYYEKRDKFNSFKTGENKEINLEKAALFIFLNKTCFNGLYRVNNKGIFNVPIGFYKKPSICDSDTLLNISDKLKNIEIMVLDYKKTNQFIDKNTFVYLDPPYRPLSKTANFTAYGKELFNDNSQRELARFFFEMDKLGAKIMLSNSDPKNLDGKDNFFEELYNAYKIKKVEANRMINCKGDKRGKLRELLILNY